jgi:hypothetical protein
LYVRGGGRARPRAPPGWVDSVFTNRLSQQQLENELRNSAEYRQKHQRR